MSDQSSEPVTARVLLRRVIKDIFPDDSRLSAFLIDHFIKEYLSGSSQWDVDEKINHLFRCVEPDIIVTILRLHYPNEYQKSYLKINSAHQKSIYTILDSVRKRSVFLASSVAILILSLSLLVSILTQVAWRKENRRLDSWRRACMSGAHIECVHLRNYYIQGCKDGNPEKCLNIAIMHLSGVGIEKNARLAAEYFKQACNMKELNGCHNLASLYLDGTGVVQDYKHARELYEYACSQSDGYLCANLGQIYADGLGTEKDPQKALSYFTRACHAGMVAGCVNIGMMYGHGEGVGRDFSVAQDYLRPACEKSESQTACLLMADLFKEKAPNSPEIISLTERACSYGSKDGCYRAGLYYEDNKNYNDAMKFYDQACQVGGLSSCFAAGLIQVERPMEGFQSAAAYYQRACDGSHWKSCNNLARLYQKGNQVTKDLKRSFEYFQRACDHGHAIACYNIAEFYRLGSIDTSNPEMAAIYYEKSCKLGERDACSMGQDRPPNMRSPH